MAGNQMRLMFSAIAYVLVEALRRIALKHDPVSRPTPPSTPSAPTLLKLGAQVRTSVRRIHFAITSGCPNQSEFAMAHLYMRRAFSSP